MPRTSEENKAYMRQWYQANKAKVNEYRRAKKDAINARKREQYASSKAVQDYYKESAKRYRQKNPSRRRHTEIRNRYGLTIEQYESLLASQGDRCAICRCEFAGTPYVDHNHTTNKPRGLLCAKCNFGIGQFNDSPELLLAAAKYLDQWEHSCGLIER